MVEFLFKASTALSWMSFGHDRDYEQVFSTNLMQGRIRLIVPIFRELCEIHNCKLRKHSIHNGTLETVLA